MDHKKITDKYLPSGTPVQFFDNLICYEVQPNKITEVCSELYRTHQLPLKIITSFDERKKGGAFKIMYVFGVPKENVFLAPFITVTDSFPSITPLIHQASIYERKIMTFFGLVPTGHPDARTLILQENWPQGVFPLRKEFPWNERPKEAAVPFQFRSVQGEGIYEIPVGPVHAGIIEPGHFRFSVAGEEILMLEPRLGYSHKGTEKLFEVLPLEKKLKLSERISGDSSFSHSMAFCEAVEKLAGLIVPEKHQLLRVIFAELERLANHMGDIGAIMIDTGFNFGGANGARLREMMMQVNDRLTGHRFLRGVNTIGGVTKDINDNTGHWLKEELEKIITDFSEVIAIAENSSSLLNRLQNTGKLNVQVAKDHGVVGVAGRALGFAADARADYPYEAYKKFAVVAETETTGDVYARFHVRIKEVYASFEIIKHALTDLTLAKAAPLETKTPALRKSSYTISIVEGWRGDIVYLVSTDAEGNIDRVDVRDPSFLNWTALGYAGLGNIVPDFPLINKSFNLSYSGNDL